MTASPFRSLASPEHMYGLTVDSASELRANPRRVASDIMRLFAARVIPITLWGPVGARKTRSIEALADEKDSAGVPFQVITIMPSTIDPTIIHGMFFTTKDPVDGSTVMMRSIPEVAQRIVKYHEDTKGYTILFMDEMTTCSPANQHALLGLMTHGKYGELEIGNLISIIMAANPEGTVSAVNPLGEQVINRGGHIAWYGDPKLFIEDWSSGFGHEHLVPRDDTQWFIKTLLEQDMGNAFRSDRWEVDELVPWDLFEHTERTTTDLAKMIDLVNEVFAEAPIEVRHFYITEATKALQGKEWASKMATVCQMERDLVDGRSIIRAIKAHEVNSGWDTEKLQLQFGSTLFEQESRARTHGSARLGQDQITAIGEDLLERAKKGNRDAYLALWVLATTAPNDGIYSALHPYVLQLFIYGGEQVSANQMMREDVRPAFVLPSIRESIKNSLESIRA